jgi:hypothetical protein
MAINLASKFSENIAQVFSATSYLSGRTAQFYDFTGVRSLRIYTPVTVPLSEYTRSGTNRYGAPQEMQDTVQELLMTQDKGFALTIDKGNSAEQMNVKAAGQMLNLQISERVVPEVDKYALGVYLREAGQVAAAEQKPGKSTIMQELGRASQKLDDALVPQEDRFLFVTSEMYSLIRLSPEFAGVERLAERAVSKGVVGEIFGAQVIKLPISYLPTDCYFLMWHKSSVLCPNKLRDAKIHSDPPGISGALLEGRWLFDAFVLGARADGVYALVLASKKQAKPEIAFADGSLTIAAGGASQIRYTADGSDPRYSVGAKIYSAPVSTEGWDSGEYTLRAVAYSDTLFTSDICEKSITVV